MQSLNLRLTRDNLSCPWGFRLQGGFDTDCPLSVQRVFSGSPAEGVLQRGDVITMLDNNEVRNLNNKEIHDIIRTSGRELTCIAERDSNKENVHNFNDIEPMASVKASRKKFINTNNEVPRPFGDFGTHYDKKDNGITTCDKLEMEHEFRSEQNRNYDVKPAENIDEKIDYSFMTLPVNERKKLFAAPNGCSLSRTMPRQRAHSFRPQQRPHEVTNNKVSNYQPSMQSQQGNWGYGNEKIITSRKIPPSQSSASLRPQTNVASFSRNVTPQFDKYSTIALPHSIEPNCRFSSSSSNQIFQIHPGNVQSTVKLEKNVHDSNKGVTAHIYRSGSNNDSLTNMSRGQDVRPLFVKTYPIRSMISSQSPQPLRAAYSAINNDRNTGDNWSTISVRSEPYPQFNAHNLGIDRSKTYRLSQEPESNNVHMNVLQMGAPRTRVIATNLSMGFNLNKPPYNSASTTRKSQQQPTYHSNAHSNSTTVNSQSLRREITLPQSKFNKVTINQIQRTNEEVFSQVSFMPQDRQSLGGASDF